MKFKDTNEDELLEKLRYNKDIEETCKSIKKINDIGNKRTNAALILYNAINYLWPYDILVLDKDEADILKETFDKLKSEVINNMSSKTEVNDLIEFSRSKYIVIDEVEINSSKYLFLINKEFDNQDACIVRNNGDKYEKINNDEEFNYVLKNIILDFKEDILEFI